MWKKKIERENMKLYRCWIVYIYVYEGLQRSEMCRSNLVKYYSLKLAIAAVSAYTILVDNRGTSFNFLVGPREVTPDVWWGIFMLQLSTYSLSSLFTCYGFHGRGQIEAPILWSLSSTVINVGEWQHSLKFLISLIIV